MDEIQECGVDVVLALILDRFTFRDLACSHDFTAHGIVTVVGIQDRAGSILRDLLHIGKSAAIGVFCCYL